MAEEETKEAPKKQLNAYATSLINVFQHKQEHEEGNAILHVNPIIAEVATWYEKVRNAMDYHEEEVILRAAIERILKRRLLFGGSGKTLAIPLVRELMWARYFPNDSIFETHIAEITQTIDRYLRLWQMVVERHEIPIQKLDTFIYQVLSSEIAMRLKPNQKKEMMTNFVYHILKDNVTIADGTAKVKDVQVFIAVRKAFAKDDSAFLRYHLFCQYFGQVTDETIAKISRNFQNGYEEIEQQLSYPFRHRITAYIKKQIPSFLILEDILLEQREDTEKLLISPKELTELVAIKCKKRYASIVSKVHRAIIRSFAFILLTKTFFAFAIEGTFETIFYGRILWTTMTANIAIPPVIMLIAALFIRTPNQQNTLRILQHIEVLLYDPSPRIGKPLQLQAKKQQKNTMLDVIFSVLWFVAFLVSFGFVISALTFFKFNIVSQGIFLFFLALVAFFIYRIYQTANTYNVVVKQNVLTPLIDFFLLPFAQVGRYLSETVSHANVFLFIFDFLIETPFKTMFGFFEEWFFFLQSKRDYLE